MEKNSSRFRSPRQQLRMHSSRLCERSVCLLSRDIGDRISTSWPTPLRNECNLSRPGRPGCADNNAAGRMAVRSLVTRRSHAATSSLQDRAEMGQFLLLVLDERRLGPYSEQSTLFTTGTIGGLAPGRGSETVASLCTGHQASR